MFGYALLIVAMLLMKLAPQSPLGRFLNFALVERPLAKIVAMERHHLIYFAIILVMATAASETVAIYGNFEWAIASAFDISIYLDAIAVTAALAASSKMRMVAQVLRASLRTARSRLGRAGRQRRRRAPR